MQLPTLKEIQKEIDGRWVNTQEHPEGGISIYNYSKLVQYAGRWNSVTMQCRGLILDAKGNVVARPFPKFFNLEEIPRSSGLLKAEFEVTEKLDGSLGILYKTPNGQYAIATRGSFSSDQAIKATQILHERYANFQPIEGFTYLFEIIYPQNRIVLDYGGLEDILLLAVIDNETGHDAENRGSLRWPFNWQGKTVVHHSSEGLIPHEILDKLGTDDGTQEGYVLRFRHEDGHVRVKVKYSEYVKIHRVVTGISSTVIWEFLSSDNNDIATLIENVPDECYEWVQTKIKELKEQYGNLLLTAEENFAYVLADTIKYPGTNNECYAKWMHSDERLNSHQRKRFSEIAQQFPNNHLIFLLLDRNFQRLNDNIWKMIKPPFEQPFNNENLPQHYAEPDTV